jgi:hypothetical protein
MVPFVSPTDSKYVLHSYRHTVCPEGNRSPSSGDGFERPELGKFSLEKFAAGNHRQHYRGHGFRGDELLGRLSQDE